MCVCVRARVRACARAGASVCVRLCVMLLWLHVCAYAHACGDVHAFVRGNELPCTLLHPTASLHSEKKDLPKRHRAGETNFLLFHTEKRRGRPCCPSFAQYHAHTLWPRGLR